MTEEELFNEYRKSNCKSFSDFLINKIAELEKENAELKKEWQEQVQEATEEGYARTLQTIQLTKAKELLKEFVHHYKAKTIYIENMQNLLEQAEQFLSGVDRC